jgi:hypothetical protein
MKEYIAKKLSCLCRRQVSLGFLLFIYFIVCVFRYIYLCTSYMSDESISSLGTRLRDSCKLPCGCWELNLSPHQNQQGLLVAEPSLQPRSLFLTAVFDSCIALATSMGSLCAPLGDLHLALSGTAESVLTCTPLLGGPLWCRQ